MVLRQLTKEQAKEEVKKLVKEFSAYTKEEQESKSENQIKSEFIDQLFEVLGWDMRKDAEREEKILKGRADYILKLGNQKVLVIEAKKTNVKLTEEEGRQAVSYAYHNKIKFSVLTNFKQMRIYHALSNIKNIDRNLLQDSKGYLWINYEDFDSQFDRLWILSKESFEKGEINKLLSAKDERQAKTVDESLLGDLLKIREWLSKEIKSKKNYLEKEKIDEIVQILIDRLIFIRSVEDRGLEPKDFLLNLDDDVRNQKVNYQLFPYIKEKFKEFNKRYDSKLFEEGLLDKEGAFSDEVLHKVIKGLYFGTEDISRERYMFDQIPCDLLGSIYEQYLGHILKGTEKRIKLESGHGKRKSMGIYYTPSYIVDYIVKNTVGEYLKNKTVDEIMLVKILDPACGSGSFLVRAFEEVCNIIEDKLKNGKFSVERAAFKDYSNRLALHQKITILTNCIYGVDLDEKAVELARLNLLLKLLENEGHETKKLLLPHLENNIKCGNSLIDDAKVSDKAFNWKAQFANVFNDGGFDVVIGNPPYVRIQTLDKKDVEYFNNTYTSPTKNYDIYILFIEKGCNLLSEAGVLGFILPHKFFQGEMGENIRTYLYQTKCLNKIVDFSTNQIFDNATTYTCLLFLKKGINNNFYYKRFELGENFKELDNIEFNKLNMDMINRVQWNFSNDATQTILDKILFKKNKFSEITKKIFKGSSTGNDKIFLLKPIKEDKDKICVFSEELNKNLWLEKQILIPFIYGEDVKRYEPIKYNKVLLFPYNQKNEEVSLISPNELRKEYPLTYNYLEEVKTQLLKRKIEIRNNEFYKYSAARSLVEYRKPKILIPDMLVKIRVNFDVNGIFFHGPAIHSVLFNDKILEQNPLFYLAILNSKLFWFFISKTSTALRGNAYRLTPEFLNSFCFPKINLTNKKDKQIHERVVLLVNQMLSLQQKYHSPGLSGNEKERLGQQIKNVDYEIDQEVYKLYGITEEEKKMIEDSLK